MKANLGNKEKFFKCSCYGEGILVSKFDKEDEIYLSFWKQGFNPLRLSFWDRLKLCWTILSKGNYFVDEVILNKRESKRMKNWLDELSKKA